MRPWLLALLVIAAAFSGCAGDAKEVLEDTDDHVDDDDHDDGHDDGHDGGHDDGHDEVANNTAPVASLEADLLNGTAPLVVNVTLDGSDADGDELSWTLRLNGTEASSGTALPTTLSFNLTAGNHTFVLTVSDGQASATVNLTIAVAQSVPAGPCGGEPEPCIIEEHPWVTVWSDGRCDAKGAIGDDGMGWIHDRPGSTIAGEGNPAGGDWPYGTGFVSGGGTWIYEETNDIPGLQLNGNLASIASQLGADEFAVGKGCVGGDTMVF